MTAKLWLLYIREILVTVNTIDAIKVCACVVSTVSLKAKSVRPRNKSHSCFASHRKITFLDCFYSYSIAAKLLKVKNFLQFLSRNPKHYFRWYRRAIGLWMICCAVLILSDQQSPPSVEVYCQQWNRQGGCKPPNHRLSLTILSVL